MLAFKNPQNGHTEKIRGLIWLWVFLFTPIYFAYKGVWRHVLVYFLITVGISTAISERLGADYFILTVVVIVVSFVYAFLGKGIIIKNYLQKGWVEVELEEVVKKRTSKRDKDRQ